MWRKKIGLSATPYASLLYYSTQKCTKLFCDSLKIVNHSVLYCTALSVPCNMRYYNALNYNILDYNAFHYTALYFNNFVALYSSALYYNSLHCTVTRIQHYKALYMNRHFLPMSLDQVWCCWSKFTVYSWQRRVHGIQPTKDSLQCTLNGIE